MKSGSCLPAERPLCDQKADRRRDPGQWARRADTRHSVRGRQLARSTRSGHSLGSFNHLGDAGKDRCRYRKAERLGGLEVQDHLELGRELHRKIARLLAA
jgi:hypothetical protein